MKLCILGDVGDGVEQLYIFDGAEIAGRTDQISEDTGARISTHLTIVDIILRF
jgi:hypothetical protein